MKKVQLTTNLDVVRLENVYRRRRIKEKSNFTLNIKEKWTLLYKGQYPEFAFILHKGKAVFSRYKYDQRAIPRSSLINFNSLRFQKRVKYNIILYPGTVISIIPKSIITEIIPYIS